MQFDPTRLKDPGFFRENREDAHSDHIAYASEQEMKEGISGFRFSLNGLWKFHHALNPDQVIPGFESAEYDCRPWADIPVPAHIQMEGYGVPQYCNTQYPWDGHEEAAIGEVPKEFNPVASYVKYFFLPESMKGQRVYVSFQGAESCAAVWLNGHYIGFSSDSFTPHDFELTPYLTEGENKLACRVDRWSAGSWLEDQDFMRFSGLFRDVFLYSKPGTHLEDLRIKTLLDDDYRDAVLQVRLKMSFRGKWTVRLCLRENGRTLAEKELNGSEEIAECSIPVENPKKWSSESPYLYDLILTVCGADGRVTEIVPQRVGFRRFEIRDSLMLINGKRIVFKGTNRHDYCAETGRAVTREKIRRDLITMKRNNINAIRTSHYPNNSALYALCDELGLYVIDENNLETHGVWDMINMKLQPLSYALPGDRQDWKEILLDRVNSTYQRDKNHPCVVIWSCGNESLGGSVIHEMSGLFHRLDDTRPVHYEGVARGRDLRYPDTTDIYSEMYTPVTQIREFQQTHRDKPFILCEYTHSMGNSNGAMHWYTEYAYEEPLYQGGFIWDFLDQSTHSRDRYGRETLLYGGDHDERPHDGNFSGNGIVFGDGTPTPKLQEVKYNYQNIVAALEGRKLKVTNRHLFTSTSDYACVVTLARNGVETARGKLETDVPPMETREYDLPFEWPERGGEYTVTASFRLKEDTAWADAGFETAFGQGVFTVKEPVKEIPCEKLRVVRGVHNLGVKGLHFEALFSYLSGGLASYRYGGKEMFKVYPMPNFWRAPTDNDRGNNMPFRCAEWKTASLYVSPGADRETAARNMQPEVIEHQDGSVSISFVYAMPTHPMTKCEVAYRVLPTGRIEVRLTYTPAEGLPEMPEFGMIMKMDADYDRLRWYGLGPEENYWDRHEGAKLGIWEKKVTDNMTRYLVPQECGNHTGVRWAEVTNYKGRGLRFIGDRMEFSALPYTPHELENAQHDYELPPVQYTVIRAALRQMGVGGDDSWGARTHDEYLIRGTEPHEFTFSFEGITG